jgi:hypothetical protein
MSDPVVDVNIERRFNGVLDRYTFRVNGVEYPETVPSDGNDKATEDAFIADRKAFYLAKYAQEQQMQPENQWITI